MKRRPILISTIVGISLVAGVGAVIAASRAHVTATPDEIPLAKVKRGEMDVRVHSTGELRASHSIMLTAPAVGGDALQITTLVKGSSEQARQNESRKRL
jgi:multidrug efflux pump subunit AcrA (membrane-fusion protein)